MRVPFKRLWVGAAVIVALLIPFLVPGFVAFQLTLVMVYGLAVLRLNLLTGFNGQFSLGHSAFFGIGAYTAAILMDRWEIAYFWTLPAAGGVCLVSGYLFGLPALRLQGIYLAGNLSAGARIAADPQIRAARTADRWRSGHRHHQTRSAARPAARR
jgi:branched-chain amino acid transport system permease protein